PIDSVLRRPQTHNTKRPSLFASCIGLVAPSVSLYWLPVDSGNAAPTTSGGRSARFSVRYVGASPHDRGAPWHNRDACNIASRQADLVHHFAVGANLQNAVAQVVVEQNVSVRQEIKARCPNHSDVVLLARNRAQDLTRVIDFDELAGRRHGDQRVPVWQPDSFVWAPLCAAFTGVARNDLAGRVDLDDLACRFDGN